MTFVPSEVIVESVGSLDEEVKRELEIPDPDPVQAAKAIKEAKSEQDENTQGND